MTSPDFKPVVVTNRGDIAAVLADLRRAQGLTCEKFDAKAGFSDRYVAKLEHGDKPQGRQGVQISPDKIRMSYMAEIWIETLGAALVLMPRNMAEAIGASPAPNRA